MRRIFRNILFFMLTGLLGILVMEGYIRYAEIEPLSNFEVDSVHGKKLRPDLPMMYLTEGFYMGETNEYGYLGPGYASDKDENRYRIALMGDSYVEGFQLFDRDHFRSILERKINGETETQVEIMNFGRSGFMISDMYVYYQKFASKFNPDKILFFVHDNDFYGVSYQALLPTLKMAHDSLVIKNDFVQSAAFENYQKTAFLRENSVYLKMMNNCYKLFKQGLFKEIVFGKLNNLLKERDKVSGGLAGNGVEAEDKAIPSINQKIIMKMAERKDVILVLTNEPSAQVQALIDKSGVPTILLYPALKELKEKGINPYYWEGTNKYGHWNHKAHKVIANTLYNELK